MFSTALPLLFVATLVAFLFKPAHYTPESFSADKVLLLTAHPDDECMFFAPTLISLAKTNEDVYTLCLSTGDADGVGDTRRAELEASLDVLGVGGAKRWIVDHPCVRFLLSASVSHLLYSELQDNITALWDASVVASVLEPYILEHGITKVFTFDRQGVSQHPNHKSLSDGVKQFIQQSTLERPPRLYTLLTVSFYEKYMGIIAPTMAKVDLLSISEKHPLPVTVFVSGFEEYWTALQAMKAHWSQLVWFRWLYVAFSRYMWVNEWVEVQL